MTTARGRVFKITLLASAFFIAASGLSFEIISGTLASYLLGDSATQFSFTIGIYLFAMGVGSYLSKFVTENVLDRFVEIELLVAIVGGLSALSLFLAFAYTSVFSLILWSLLLFIGMLVGLEIPLLLRILKDHVSFKDLISNVLSLDYIGGLAAAIAIPLFLTPKLGLVKSALLFGFLNAMVAMICACLFRNDIRLRRYMVAGSAIALLLVTLFFYSGRLIRHSESQLYADNVVFTRTSVYQRIVLTKWANQFSLFLNNNLQFNSHDEYRYHEALVHPGLAHLEKAHPQINALVMGGGDGLAIREILKSKSVARVDLVELDPAMTDLARDNSWLAELNGHSLKNKKVSVIHQDAFVWLKNTTKLYDLVIIDFPDPSNFSLGKLYSRTFYHRLSQVMKPHGIAITQATSPLFARKAYWCIVNTIKGAGFNTHPYHTYIPSFGEWGFVLFSRADYQLPQLSPALKLRYLTDEIMAAMFHFSRDMSRVETLQQKLNNQQLVAYYTEGWNAITK